MECKKCKISSPDFILLRGKDPYCRTCFEHNINHKFRSSIGKNRVFSSKENVLLGVSGGIGSSVMLNLVSESISLNNHKNLRINPVCVHIIDLHDDQKLTSLAEGIIEKCNQFHLDVYLVHISDYYSNVLGHLKNSIPHPKDDSINKLKARLQQLKNTEHNDFLLKVKNNLYIRTAEALHCNFVFTAETSITLASQLLSNVALGRGSQIGYDTGFLDSRDSAVKILRPMKDITQEELQHYADLKNIQYSNYYKYRDNSLQSLMKTFVVDLQENFPATVSTICKTAEKIGNYKNGTNKKCTICQSAIIHTAQDSKLTAYEATKYSKAVSTGVTEVKIFHKTENSSLYCYTCNNQFNE